MILEGNQRGGARQMARHLLNCEDNEHVEVYEVSGFLAQNVHGALQEICAASRGTKCTQFMFALSLSPPRAENVPVASFENALRMVEEKLGLQDQPRVIVFHEKEGRRHAHCIWSRIDAGAMKSINLPHYKMKLQDISRELYLQHGWEMPKGFVDSRYRDPKNFTHEQWQQARRTGEDPRMLKTLFAQCWKQSDSRAAFENALRDYGFRLARGDRRGFVVLDYNGEVYSLSRWAGVTSKDLAARLGDPAALPSVTQAKAEIAATMTDTLKTYIRESKTQARQAFAPYKKLVQGMKTRHREERQILQSQQDQRWTVEEQARLSRLPKGLKGFLNWITGKAKKLRLRNEQETQECRQRDKDERQALIASQLQERGNLQDQIAGLRDQYQKTWAELRLEIGRYHTMGEQAQAEQEQTQEEQSSPSPSGNRRKRQGPDFSQSG